METITFVSLRPDHARLSVYYHLLWYPPRPCSLASWFPAPGWLRSFVLLRTRP